MSKVSSQSQVISIMGPTASGKTGLALELAKQIDCEIISVDSALIYKQMDIGTAKPSAEELAQVPHWLIDIVDPVENYSVAEFCQQAFDCIQDIQSRGKVPVLVGGTMMYFNALINGISKVPETDPLIRQKVNQQALEQGWDKMHAELQDIDPIVAARVHPNDPQRIGRAIEVFRMTGKNLSYWQAQKSPGLADKLQVPIRQFAIAPTDRKVLHQRIQARYGQMLDAGFIDEVMELRNRGDLNLNMPSMRCVGYRQVWQYLDNEYEYQEMVEKGVAATRQLAKRQFTWLRSWQSVSWLDTFGKTNVAKIVGLATI